MGPFEVESRYGQNWTGWENENTGTGTRHLDELDEGDEKTPGVGPVHNQSLQQHPAGQPSLWKKWQRTKYLKFKTLNIEISENGLKTVQLLLWVFNNRFISILSHTVLIPVLIMVWNCPQITDVGNFRAVISWKSGSAFSWSPDSGPAFRMPDCTHSIV